MIRFCLHPGPMISVNDGDLHHISAPQLADLYGVRLSECIVIDMDRPETGLGRRPEDLLRLLHLFPSYQGAAYWKISETERSLYPLPWEPTPLVTHGAAPEQEDLEAKIYRFCRRVMSP